MADKEYTQDGLPVVTGPVLEVMLRDIFGNSDSQNEARWNEFMERVKNENPQLYATMEKLYGEDLMDLSKREGFLLGFNFAYEALRKQGETNKYENLIREASEDGGTD